MHPGCWIFEIIYELSALIFVHETYVECVYHHPELPIQVGKLQRIILVLLNKTPVSLAKLRCAENKIKRKIRQERD